MLYLVSSLANGLVLPASHPLSAARLPAINPLAKLTMQAENFQTELGDLRAQNIALQEAEEQEKIKDMRAARLGVPIFALSALGIVGSNAPPDSSPLVEAFQEATFEAGRSGSIDRRAEAAMAKYYPGSLGSLTTDKLVSGVLAGRGYTRENTLFATSTCPDEVNSKPRELIDLFKNRWGENFQLGGLAGVPFTGKAGFAAYAHHVPNDGKMLIMFAPHVGVEFDGKVGQLQRVNQDEVSSACGAAVGAFKAIMKEKQDEQGTAYEVQDGVSDYFDAQINFIKLKLKARIEKVMDAPDAQAFVSYQMYALVREFFIDELLTAPGIWDYASEITVLGGIMVNRGVGGDRFQPLMLQSRKQETGTTVDLYSKTFGKPDEKKLNELLLGSIPDLFAYDLETYQLTTQRQAMQSKV